MRGIHQYWVVFGLLVVLFVGRPAQAEQLRLLDTALTAPEAPTPQPDHYAPMPVGNRVGAILLGAWAGASINVGLEVLPLILVLAIPDATLSMPLSGQVQLSLGLSFIQSLASAGAIWGIARALGGHPSFLMMWGISGAARFVVCALAIAAGSANGGWTLGTFLFAPLLGLTAELITAQFDEVPHWEAVPPPLSSTQTSETRAVVVPVLARSF